MEFPKLRYLFFNFLQQKQKIMDTGKIWIFGFKLTIFKIIDNNQMDINSNQVNYINDDRHKQMVKAINLGKKWKFLIFIYKILSFTS